MVHNPTVIRETLFLKMLTKLLFFLAGGGGGGGVETTIGSLVVCGVVLFSVFSIVCITSFSPGGEQFSVIG